jgi:H+/Cl- antiporter ClcA
MELKTITWYIILVVIGFFTLGFMLIIELMENLIYFGRGYKCLADNDSTKFYLVILAVTGVTVGVKLIINIGLM